MTFLAGFKSGLRLVLKQPALGLACVLIMAVGMALATTLLSLVYGVLVRPAPFEGAERWVHVKTSRGVDGGAGWGPVSPEELLHWRRGQTSFETLTAYSMHMSFVTAETGPTEVYVAAEVTSELLALTGVRPLAGRWIETEDEKPGAPDVAVIGHRLWQRHFLQGRVPQGPGAEVDSAVGARISINGRVATVIGVAPEGFEFPHSQQLWVPLRLNASNPGGDGYLNVLAIPKDGPRIGRAELEMLSAGLVEPSTRDDGRAARRVLLEPFVASQADPQLKKAVTPMVIAVLAMLGIACLNVAGLMLTRTIRKGRETAIRVALGALPGRLTTFALGEAAALAGLGTVLGLAGASALITEAVDFLGRGQVLQGFWAEPRLDPWVLAGVLVLAVASTLIAAVLPAWWAGRVEPTDALRQGSGGNTSGQGVKIADLLVVAEVALATVLLVISWLMVSSIRNLSAVNLGFETDHRVVAKVSLLRASDGDSARRFFDGVRQQLLAQPDVEAVGFASTGPADGSFWRQMSTVGREDGYAARWSVVSPYYFAALGVDMVSGRGFADHLDSIDGPPVAIVSRSFAEKHLAPGPAEGQKVQWADDDPSAFEVVGVVEDLVMGPVDDPRSEATLYLPSGQRPRASMVMVVAGRDAAPTPHRLREAVSTVDRTAGSFDIKTLSSVVQQRRWLYDGFAGLFGLFGLVSLGLTLAGLYALVAAASRQRARELGIRLALGAGRGDILKQVMGLGAWRLTVGAGLGALAAVPITVWVESVLYQVSPTDPWIYAGAVLMIWLFGMHAVLAPALEASGIDPASTLRASG